MALKRQLTLDQIVFGIIGCERLSDFIRSGTILEKDLSGRQKCDFPVLTGR